MCYLKGLGYLQTQKQLKPTNNQGKLQPPRPFKQQGTASFAKVLTYLVVYAGHGQNVMQGRVFLRLSPTSKTVPELEEKIVGGSTKNVHLKKKKFFLTFLYNLSYFFNWLQTSLFANYFFSTETHLQRLNSQPKVSQFSTFYLAVRPLSLSPLTILHS